MVGVYGVPNVVGRVHGADAYVQQRPSTEASTFGGNKVTMPQTKVFISLLLILK